MKILIFLLLVGVVLLFFPNYELWGAQKDFNQVTSFKIIEKGFLTRERCRNKAKQLKIENYQCRKRSIWEGSFSGFLKYNYEPPRSDKKNEND